MYFPLRIVTIWKKNALWTASFTTQWCSCLQKGCRCSYSKLVLSCVDMMKGSGKQLTNGVSGGFLALLVHAVVTSNCPVSSFRFNSLAIRADQHAGHHPQRAIAYTIQVTKVQGLLWTAPSNCPLSPHPTIPLHPLTDVKIPQQQSFSSASATNWQVPLHIKITIHLKMKSCWTMR